MKRKLIIFFLNFFHNRAKKLNIIYKEKFLDSKQETEYLKRELKNMNSIIEDNQKLIQDLKM